MEVTVAEGNFVVNMTASSNARAAPTSIKDIKVISTEPKTLSNEYPTQRVTDSSDGRRIVRGHRRLYSSKDFVCRPYHREYIQHCVQ